MKKITIGTATFVGPDSALALPFPEVYLELEINGVTQFLAAPGLAERMAAVNERPEHVQCRCTSLPVAKRHGNDSSVHDHSNDAGPYLTRGDDS